MSESEAKPEASTELSPGDITEFIVVLTQLNKGRTQAELTKALHEVVEAALATEKKGGSVTLKIKVEPLESGAVSLIPDVSCSPAKDPAGTVFFTDGDGTLSRDNVGMFYGTR
ncbi:hypothetical protein OS122_02705 [Mycolicibacterium mucogenicum]|uniref:hypothetical protein n=1 Tax=Mycolicibacterium mucogenicum TaxID=56689 RepID=UPI00226A48A5|nr:hypothetical protein [Mycolicibacterium mucogenicum]MCX8559809.1 hypothetical protein [Mycolicibacterium mucogenicum]